MISKPPFQHMLLDVDFSNPTQVEQLRTQLAYQYEHCCYGTQKIKTIVKSANNSHNNSSNLLNKDLQSSPQQKKTRVKLRNKESQHSLLSQKLDQINHNFTEKDDFTRFTTIQQRKKTPLLTGGRRSVHALHEVSQTLPCSAPKEKLIQHKFTASQAQLSPLLQQCLKEEITQENSTRNQFLSANPSRLDFAKGKLQMICETAPQRNPSKQQVIKVQRRSSVGMESVWKMIPWGSSRESQVKIKKTTANSVHEKLHTGIYEHEGGHGLSMNSSEISIQIAEKKYENDQFTQLQQTYGQDNKKSTQSLGFNLQNQQLFQQTSDLEELNRSSQTLNIQNIQSHSLWGGYQPKRLKDTNKKLDDYRFSSKEKLHLSQESFENSCKTAIPRKFEEKIVNEEITVSLNSINRQIQDEIQEQNDKNLCQYSHSQNRYNVVFLNRNQRVRIHSGSPKKPMKPERSLDKPNITTLDPRQSTNDQKLALGKILSLRGSRQSTPKNQEIILNLGNKWQKRSRADESPEIRKQQQVVLPKQRKNLLQKKLEQQQQACVLKSFVFK